MPVPKKKAPAKKKAPTKKQEPAAVVPDDDDLAPDADEPGDEAPDFLHELVTPSDQIIPDKVDGPDPKGQVS